MHSEVTDAKGNVKCNLTCLWACPSSILVTGDLLRALPIVLIFVYSNLTYFGQCSFYCIMYKVKLLAKLASLYQFQSTTFAPKCGGLSRVKF